MGLQVMALPGKQQGRQRAVASAIQHGLAYLCSLVLRRTSGGSARYMPCLSTSAPVYMAKGVVEVPT